MQNTDSAQRPTWADLEHDNVDQIVIAINIEGGDAPMTKRWIRSQMDPAHWARILHIAESPVDHADLHLGHSWVTEAVMNNGQTLDLRKPRHLTERTATDQLGQTLHIDDEVIVAGWEAAGLAHLEVRQIISISKKADWTGGLELVLLDRTGTLNGQTTTVDAQQTIKLNRS